MARQSKKEEAVSIKEKVKFWEEQDRINKKLIPRVLCLSELLGKHIAEHENLPNLFAGELAKALKKQSSQFESELKNAKKVLDKELLEATSKQSEQAQRELMDCLDRLKEEHKNLRAKLMDETKRVLEKQHEKWEKSRKQLTAIVVVSALVTVASAISVWL